MHTVVGDGRWLGLPGAVGAHRLCGAVGVGELQLQSEAFLAEVGQGDVEVESVVEAVSEQYAQRVSSLLQLLGHVIGKVHHAVSRHVSCDGYRSLVQVVALGVVGHVGHQVVVPDALPVDV